MKATVLMYDLRNFDKQPFLTVHIDDPILRERTFPARIPVFTSVSYSNDSKWLLVGTSGDTHYVLDAYDGNVVARLEGKVSLSLFLSMKTLSSFPCELHFR